MRDTITLRISRSAYIEENIDVAKIRLDTHPHIIGQPVMVRYYTENGDVDTITAIGIKNGTGRDCYSVITTGQEFIVNAVSKTLPDVSRLVNSGIYVCEYSGVWNLVYLDERKQVRELDPNIPNPTIFKDLESGFRWFYVDGRLTREDEFLTESEIIELVKDMIPTQPGEGLSTSIEGQSVFEKGTVFSNPVFLISVVNLGKNVTEECELRVSYPGQTKIELTKLGTGRYTVGGNFTETTRFTVYANYKEREFAKSVDITCVDKTCLGYSDNPETEPESYTEFLWSGKSNIELFFSLQDQVSILLIPSDLPQVKQILDIHGLDYYDDYDITENFIHNGKQYVRYCKKDPVKINNFRQLFIVSGGFENIQVENYE